MKQSLWASVLVLLLAACTHSPIAQEHSLFPQLGTPTDVEPSASATTTIVIDASTVPEAIDRPRWRLQAHDLVVERSLPREVTDALAGMGHSLLEVTPGHRSFGSVVAAGLDASTGSCFGAADLRRESTSGAA